MEPEALRRERKRTGLVLVAALLVAFVGVLVAESRDRIVLGTVILCVGAGVAGTMMERLWRLSRENR
jgi:hypothetical protein